ncbi:DUF4265 domain-containing protein [Corynebacterium tapiri]|uniref:DUF4265 domain-containing protein n=1 Tax=Corynebacterium tapiri TaxID=1448266 RepID=UPI001FE91F06|nr:DUF4265 domain-containing protein [Corynebacterium tapiri]
MTDQTVVATCGSTKEELRARALGQGRFVLTSIPFVCADVALGDIVACVKVAQRWHVDRVEVRGGNSTLRILPHGVDVASPLLQLGLAVEEGPAGVIAVNVGPDDPREGLMEWLEQLREQEVVEVSPGYWA